MLGPRYMPVCKGDRKEVPPKCQFSAKVSSTLGALGEGRKPLVFRNTSLGLVALQLRKSD